ncbi:MAG: glycoside hydrolase family 2 TIM barrel-domain containing protein [Pyrinomonadaceae bacterium]
MTDTKLNRRNFLKTTAVGAAGLSILANTANAETAIEPTLAPSLSQRHIFPLNHKWLYSDTSSTAAMQTAFNDRGWKQVTIPHTNKMLPMNGFDEKEYTFISAYRRHFRLPKELKDHRIFVDFGGVMTAAKVFINGKSLGQYKGGYTPFSFELTKDINWTGENVLAVEVDSTERADIPPFGNLVDYMTFGGIYRDVQIRAVPKMFIENIFAKPVDVLSDKCRISIKVSLSQTYERPLKVTATLYEGEKRIGIQFIGFKDRNIVEFDFDNFDKVTLWNLENPKLYNLRVSVDNGPEIVDHYETRIGFREAKFTPEGFYLNGKHVKLRGLNRHQTYPYLGQAMPERGQRKDAEIIKKELKCNIVRTSHYPQSPHFLDACDEIGLLVFEEIPGWQHVGDQAWKDLAERHVREMIERDWNHPSIIMWGVRVNESGDDHDLYTKTNALAHKLDDSRQTGGVRYRYPSERLEDVFTMNDFGFPLRPPNHPLYLNTEFSGHMFPTKRFDLADRLREHTHRHARVHDALAGDVKYAGGIGWCAFDYNTHAYFGSGDRICYHGVSDIFRIPKPAAGFYKSQCDPSEEIVLEPAFHWACGDENEAFTYALVSSNCEKLKYFVGETMVAEAEPDRKTYPNLKYAPFNPNIRSSIWGSVPWADMRIEGYIGGKKVIERKLSGKGVDRDFVIKPDDTELRADGIDMTRVVFRVTDEYGNDRPFATGAIQFTIENGELIGENPFALVGGVGAVWVRSTERAGTIKLTAKHPRHGTKTVTINAKAVSVPSI